METRKRHHSPLTETRSQAATAGSAIAENRRNRKTNNKQSIYTRDGFFFAEGRISFQPSNFIAIEANNNNNVYLFRSHESMCDVPRAAGTSSISNESKRQRQAKTLAQRTNDMVYASAGIESRGTACTARTCVDKTSIELLRCCQTAPFHQPKSER